MLKGIALKALTVRQPWARLIMDGIKTIEVRSWPPDVLGRILVHAGSRLEEEACGRLRIAREELVTGAILGSLRIVHVFQFTEKSWEELRPLTLEAGALSGPLLGWRLGGPIFLEEPLPWRGKLGLFDVPDEVIPEPVRVGHREFTS